MVTIRRFQPGDEAAIVEILRMNDQYGNPEIDGPEAMRRVADCEAAEFLVAEMDGVVVGLVRGAYDGSRAIIHLLSVHPRIQRRGIGKTLVTAIAREFERRDAPSMSATVTADSLGFWTRIGFRKLDVFLVLADDVSVFRSRASG